MQAKKILPIKKQRYIVSYREYSVLYLYLLQKQTKVHLCLGVI